MISDSRSWWNILEMDGLAVHLSHSMLFDIFHQCRLRFRFLLFTVLISCLASSCGACQVFKCGSYVFGYPFGGRNSGCGDPALQLDCDHEQYMPVINISGFQYYIKYPHTYVMPSNKLDKNSTHNMTLIDRSLQGDKCNIPSPSNNTAQFWSSPQFHIRGEYENLTLLQQCAPEIIGDLTPLPCNSSWYYSSKSDTGVDSKCESRVVLPVQKSKKRSIEEQILDGFWFRIEWNVSENCSVCDSNGGRCAYDNRSMEFCSGANGLKTKRTIIRSVAIGTGALLFIAVSLVVFYRKRLFSSSSKNPHLSTVEKFLNDYVHEMPARYSYSQLKKITNNFADKLGEGGFGVVYKGNLPSGNVVAVKMLDQSRQSETQFVNEVATIGRIHHIHLVRLLGYCFEGFRSALLYEYMANGSLDKLILARRNDRKNTLNWQQLYSIALGAARGIAYLHAECHSRIIHFDIKPHNILLDEEFTAKVADFGLAKLCGRRDDHVSVTVARGTPGYIAPEVWSRNLGPVTDKSDVYGFGMMLLEMVGGTKNIDVQVSRSSQLYFPECAFKMIESGELPMRLRERNGGELQVAEEENGMQIDKSGIVVHSIQFQRSAGDDE
ncbi:hypothetical protein KI387_010710, partial [Taxus chinensis]